MRTSVLYRYLTRRLAARPLSALLIPLFLPCSAKAAGSHTDALPDTLPATETVLSESWTRYYLDAFSLPPDLETVRLVCRAWFAALWDVFTGLSFEKTDLWLSTGWYMLLLPVIAGLGAVWLLGRGRSAPTAWNAACRRLAWCVCPLIGVGSALLCLAFTASASAEPGFLLLAAGSASLPWALSPALPKDNIAARLAMLPRLYAPAVFAIFLCAFYAPVQLSLPLWATVLLLSLFSILCRPGEAGQAEGKNSFSERGLPMIFYLLALLPLLAGYARLSMCVFLILCVLTNVIITGAALARLLDLAAKSLSAKESGVLRQALLQSLILPLAWSFALFSALPCLLSLPGGAHMLGSALYFVYDIGGFSLNLLKVLLIIPLFFLFRALSGLGRASLEHLPERLPGLERGVIPPLCNIMSYGMWLLFALLTLGMLGLNLSSLAMVAGGLSVGVGFGLQHLFSNMVSGVMLIAGRSILVGDYVEIGGTAGIVTAINIRATTLETAERALVYVPNSTIMSGQFINWTRGGRSTRRSLSLSLPAGIDSAAAARLILDTAGRHPKVLAEPTPSVYLNKFGVGGLEFILYVDIDDVAHTGEVLSDLRFALERSLAVPGACP